MCKDLFLLVAPHNILFSYRVEYNLIIKAYADTLFEPQV